jgi:hypothetical protein
MAKYKYKPLEIEAIQWNGSNFDDIKNFANNKVRYDSHFDHNKYYEDKNTLIIKTLEGDTWAFKGDFIIKGVKGEYYPCKPEIFEKTFEKI